MLRLFVRLGKKPFVASRHSFSTAVSKPKVEAVAKSWINGKYVDNKSGRTYVDFNPATGRPLTNVQIAEKVEVDDAVAAAQEAFKIWSTMSGVARGRVLHKASRILRERNDELAALETLDNGKPIQEALAVDVASGYDCLEYFAGLASSVCNMGMHIDTPHAGGHRDSFGYTRREPIGVCGSIGAWNYPIQIAVWKSAPALACGNTVVFKPSEETPLTALKVAEVYKDAGLPDGAFNVITGDRATGQLLVAHPRVPKLSFTGSNATGKAIMRESANHLKKITLELGGKSPLLVFADCNLDNAVSAAIMGNFYTMGEVCSNSTRVFVEESIKDEFLRRLVARTAKIVVGDPMNPATQAGALVSKAHGEKVMAYIDTAIKEGGRLVYGGKRVQLPGELAGGFYVQPTIFDNLTDNMTIVREEVFGPVMSVLTFKDEDEAVARANDTELGLSAGVMTNNLARGHRVVKRLQAGTCWINNYNLCPVELPFGGNKQSGFGRENSQYAIESFTQIKSVYVEMGDVAAPY